MRIYSMNEVKRKNKEFSAEFWDNPYIEKFDFEKAYNEMMKKFEERFKNEQVRKVQ